MSRWSKTTPKLEEREIFGDEEFAAMRVELDQLGTLVAELNSQLHAQFTTIAAHAEIAREQSDFAREEARADLERTRAMLIDLIEQARRRSVSSYPPPAAPAASDERIAALEDSMAALGRTVADCARRQHELTDMMTALVDNVLAADHDTPVAGLSLA